MNKILKEKPQSRRTGTNMNKLIDDYYYDIIASPTKTPNQLDVKQSYLCQKDVLPFNLMQILIQSIQQNKMVCIALIDS